ncbi:hypothetical protein [Persicobacter diffluens]|uniref:Uncharacterized protein n=1 Tax=Persicobacter diffluens TaxID=981 RepID=A0AAN4W497_9BACT|nr:hypothetical protein PEDI_55400 [Persicobacter diffluens]
MDERGLNEEDLTYLAPLLKKMNQNYQFLGLRLLLRQWLTLRSEALVSFSKSIMEELNDEPSAVLECASAMTAYVNLLKKELKGLDLPASRLMGTLFEVREFFNVPFGETIFSDELVFEFIDRFKHDKFPLLFNSFIYFRLKDLKLEQQTRNTISVMFWGLTLFCEREIIAAGRTVPTFEPENKPS